MYVLIRCVIKALNGQLRIFFMTFNVAREHVG